MHNVKQADISYAEATAQPVASPQQSQHSSPAALNQPDSETPAPAPAFDYQAVLQCISHNVETTLRAKFDAAIANLQKSLDNIDQHVDHKLQTHMAALKASQADKTTQDNHTQQLESMTKTFKSLV